MTISIANDHAGFPLRQFTAELLRELGFEVLQHGVDSPDPVDFPDVVAEVCNDIQAKRAERGVLVCGTGVGASMAANKHRGIRAAVIHDCHTAHQGVEHDDMNVLCLGAQIVGPWLARDIITTFLNAKFSNTPELVRRVGKMTALESQTLND